VAYVTLSGLMDQGLFGQSGHEHHLQPCLQPIQDQLNDIEYGNYNYWAALCQSQIVIKDEMLIFNEPI
jgi:hypothetical protein